jgi:hypothetical protein
LYARLQLLCDALLLPACEKDSPRVFVDELKCRLQAKASHLESLLPGITRASALDAVARSSVMLSWERVEHIFEKINCGELLEQHMCDVIDTLPGAFEPNLTNLPLAPLPRVAVRWFADRLRFALRLDVPHACDVTAKLYGARDWYSLVGRKPFLPVSERLYHYRIDEATGFAYLEPCDAARQCDEEFDAMTLLRHDMFQSELAQDEFVDRPGLLCAAAVGATKAVEERDFQGAEFRATRSLAEFDAIYPSDCRAPLAPDVPTHAWYVRLRAALCVSLFARGEAELAEAELQVLRARGREYRAEYESLLATWAPRPSKPFQRATLRLVG